MQNTKIEWTGRVNVFLERMQEIFLWKRPKRIFVGSMCDLFNEVIPFLTLDVLWVAMLLNPRHTFIILTKRPERMREFFLRYPERGLLPNVHLGVTVCNQVEADAKIPILLDTPAAKRFVSVEPMLGPLDFKNIPAGCPNEGDHLNALEGVEYLGDAAFNVPRLDWVICGGETGPGARPMHPDWARSLRDQCQAARTPFFFKQWGEWAPDCLCQTKEAHKTIKRPNPGKLGCMFHCGKRRSGRLLDGREWNEFPEVA